MSDKKIIYNYYPITLSSIIALTISLLATMKIISLPEVLQPWLIFNQSFWGIVKPILSIFFIAPLFSYVAMFVCILAVAAVVAVVALVISIISK